MIVYLIINKINGKQYVGQTTHAVQKRWKAHCGKNNKCTAIGRAIQKYSKENFIVKTIYIANSMEELNKKEQEFIKEFNTLAPNGYNLTTGGMNYIASNETKRKLSERQKGKKNHLFGKRHTEATKLKISNSQIGKLISNETLKKQSLSCINKRPIICNQTKIHYESISLAAKELGIAKHCIRDVLARKSKQTKGLTFSYL